MRKVLFFLIIGLISSVITSNDASAQFSFTPSSTYSLDVFFDEQNYGGIMINNDTPSELYLEWSLVSIDTMPGCSFDLCATGYCYLGIPATGSFPTILGNEVGFLKMHYWSGSEIGSNTAKVYVFEPSDPNNGDTLTFVFNVTGPNSIEKYTDRASISIFPNPATNLINIKGSTNHKYAVEVYNAVGQKVIHSTGHIGKSILQVEHLPKGIYQIVLEDEKGDVVREKLLKL